VVSSRDICDRLGERIRELRNAKGLSQITLAEKLGIDRAYLSLVENGKQELCVRNIDLLAQGLGVSLSQLFKDI
jgi:transcriptional regulator with XRE-family HTH domain